MSGVEGPRPSRASFTFLAAISFAAFLLLGLAVHRYGEPAALLAFDHALVNHGALAAWWITQIGKAYVLIAVSIVLAIVAWVKPEWRGRVVFSLVMLLLSWRAADFFQHVFARPRRLDWVIYHETSFSYPSSHAAIAIAFFGLWAWLLSRYGHASTARAGAVVFALVALALCWSRLALGAHYVTDVAGGALLGVALLFGGVALWPEIATRERRERA